MVKAKKTTRVQKDFFDDTINIRNCKLGYECKQDWFGLVETKDEHIKYCSECEKSVYMIVNDTDLMEAIRGNRCVAIKIPSKSHIMVGMRISVETDYEKPAYLRNKK
jgi:hypothetical protein